MSGDLVGLLAVGLLFALGLFVVFALGGILLFYGAVAALELFAEWSTIRAAHEKRKIELDRL